MIHRAHIWLLLAGALSGLAIYLESPVPMPLILACLICAVTSIDGP